MLYVKGYKMRSINAIASDIQKDWKNISYNAKPYLEAMHGLNTINDNYGYDSGAAIVRYFLANASQWKGEKAKAIKLELKQLVK